MNARPRFDLHVHSHHSPDSAETLERIAARASTVGLSGFALTDHNSIRGHAELGGLARRWPDLIVVPGVEVSTREGHLLLYGISELPPIHAPLTDTVLWARARRAVPVLAHPFRWAHGVGRAVAASADVAALETHNAHNGARANRRSEDLRSSRRLGATGGSDAHHAEELGLSVTVVRGPIGSVPELLAELAAGRTESEGDSLGPAAQFALAFRTLRRRASRGFRPI